jgi:serine/threonine protein kinase
MMMSLVSTLAHMQSVGLCHRDLKPANLFLMNSGSIKVIDFGESKDYFKPEEDGGNATTATIRGTPQYLSPILWKAHVVDGNSRFAKHNIYKSDVFSVGLLFYQLAMMEDVTGFNQKSAEYDGEKLVAAGIQRMRDRFDDHICKIMNSMLKFYEKDRLSFVELHKAMLMYP